MNLKVWCSAPTVFEWSKGRRLLNVWYSSHDHLNSGGPFCLVSRHFFNNFTWMPWILDYFVCYLFRCHFHTGFSMTLTDNVTVWKLDRKVCYSDVFGIQIPLKLKVDLIIVETCQICNFICKSQQCISLINCFWTGKIEVKQISVLISIQMLISSRPYLN